MPKEPSSTRLFNLDGPPEDGEEDAPETGHFSLNEPPLENEPGKGHFSFDQAPDQAPMEQMEEAPETGHFSFDEAPLEQMEEASETGHFSFDEPPAEKTPGKGRFSFDEAPDEAAVEDTGVNEENAGEAGEKPDFQKKIYDKDLSENKAEIIAFLRSKISPENFGVAAAFDHIEKIEEKDTTYVLYFTSKMHYDMMMSHFNFLQQEVHSFIGSQYSISLQYKPELLKDKPKTVSEINKENIIEIFNGREIL